MALDTRPSHGHVSFLPKDTRPRVPQGPQQTSDSSQRVNTAASPPSWARMVLPSSHGWGSASSSSERSQLKIPFLAHRTSFLPSSPIPSIRASVPNALVSSEVTKSCKPLTLSIANSRTELLLPLCHIVSSAFSSPASVIPMCGVPSCPQGIRKPSADRLR